MAEFDPNDLPMGHASKTVDSSPARGAKYVRFKDTIITPIDLAWWRRRILRWLLLLLMLVVLALVVWQFRATLSLTLTSTYSWLLENPNAAAALAACLSVVVALMALIIVSYEGVATRRHWQRTTRPHVVVNVNQAEPSAVEVSIANRGSGLAIVIEILIDRGASLHPHLAGWLRFLLSKSPSLDQARPPVYYEEPAVPLLIHPEETVTLLSLPSVSHNGPKKQEEEAATKSARVLLDELASTVLLLKYVDIYGKRYMLRSQIGDYLRFRSLHRRATDETTPAGETP